ncbi:MAG: right-handed parallel beta-helix repeat-containing protein [Deltaproteobacteria bacterium]
MNIRIAVLIVGLAGIGCTKHNPAVCCNTPTQCSSFGLDGVTGCDTGKVCDSDGACIAPQCASSAECADSTPYCSNAGLCEMACTVDTECPGGGQAANQVHCSGGACVECANAADCPAAAPVCASSACRICQQDSECASEVCATDGDRLGDLQRVFHETRHRSAAHHAAQTDARSPKFLVGRPKIRSAFDHLRDPNEGIHQTDGTCVAPDMIAYVAPAASDGADCSIATPCSLTHGVSLGRTYTLLVAGTYQLQSGITITGTRWLIGVGAAEPTITRSTGGPIITVGIASHLHVAHLALSGATNTNSTSFDGSAIACPNDTNPRTLDLVDVAISTNEYFGVDGSACAVTATRSSFTHNFDGMFVKDNNATIDSCEFSRNAHDGLDFDGSVATVTNSFFTNNSNHGAEISSGVTGGRIQFCTAVNNFKYGLAVGIPASTTFDLTNNLMANNMSGGILCSGGTCPLAGSITLGADVTTAHFKSSTDFHITAGSVAIDAASGSTLDHDYDGDVRPLGNGRDVGADEAQ